MTNENIKKNMLNIITGCLGAHLDIHSSYLSKEGLTNHELVEIINKLNQLLMSFRQAMIKVTDAIE